MPFKYEEVVPWGRNYTEYVNMFSLTAGDLGKKILGCGDGPASFNFGMTRMGKRVTSIDPIYQFTKEEIECRIAETYQNVISQTRQNKDKFIWNSIKDVDELGKTRMSAMEEFLSDYEIGKRQNRYIFAELPNLPFSEKQFDISLASHFLFLYTQNLSLEFHIEAIDEMLRVSKEVRIFPLVDVNAVRSDYVDKVMDFYRIKGYTVDEQEVNYEFQKGANTMLTIKG